MGRLSKIIAWMGLIGLVGLGACAPADSPGCRNDQDCRADRICTAGLCQEPVAQDPNNNTPDNNGRIPDDNNGVSPSDMGNDFVEPDEGIADVSLPDIRPEDVAEDVAEPEDVPAPEDIPAPEDMPDVVDDVGSLDQGSPDTGSPDTGSPDVDEPDAGLPDVGEPDVEEDVDEPDVPELPQEPVLLTSVESVDFGQVGLFVTAEVEIELSNGGQEDLHIDEIRLDEVESRGFRVFVPALPLVLASGEVARVSVLFQPTALIQNQATPYSNALFIQSNDPERQEVSLALTGLATPSPAQCLSFGLREINFGQVRPGNIVNSSIEVINCGQEPIEVDSVSLEGSLTGVSVQANSPLPFRLLPGQRQSLFVSYAPMQFEAIEGVLRAEAGSVVALAQIQSQVQEVNGLRVTLRWDNGADMDLHLVRSEEDDEGQGDFGSFGNQENVLEDDCYWNNLNPDWGDEDGQDPLHDGDTLQGPGQESLALARRQRGRRYRIGALFVRNNQNIGTVNATVTVELGDTTQTLTRSWNRQQYWVPFVIEADGRITVVNEFINN